MPTIITLWNLLRKVPKPVIELILAIARDVAGGENKSAQWDIAWRARCAAHEAVMEAKLRGKL